MMPTEFDVPHSSSVFFDSSALFEMDLSYRTIRLSNFDPFDRLVQLIRLST
jgi:hypothetical protein